MIDTVVETLYMYYGCGMRLDWSGVAYVTIWM